jgi:hypothetical protein
MEPNDPRYAVNVLMWLISVAMGYRFWRRMWVSLRNRAGDHLFLMPVFLLQMFVNEYYGVMYFLILVNYITQPELANYLTPVTGVLFPLSMLCYLLIDLVESGIEQSPIYKKILSVFKRVK